MKIIKYIILGLIQGLTEPLPVSSSAHVFLFSKILSIDIDLNFEIIVNFASCLAIIIFLRKDLLEILSSFFIKGKFVASTIKYIFFLIPLGIFGIIFKNTIDLYFLNVLVISINLIITSIILFFSKKIYTPNKENYLSYSSAFVISFTQILALFPGISRSGISIFSGLISKSSLRSTLKYSFYIYVIASFFAFLTSLNSIVINLQNALYLLFSFIAAFLSTYISIKLIFKYLSPKIFLFFSFWCIIVAILGFCLY